jgi:hypothetical protein
LIERNPVLGFLSPEVRADLLGKNGNEAQDLAMAKMGLGTVYALTFAGLAAEGYANGSGPTDRNKFFVWRYMQGNLPHAVKIGNFWFDVHKLGPLGLLASTAFDMYDVAHALSAGEGTQVARMFMHAITQNLLDESFMRGPADLIKAIEDSGRYGESYIRNFLTGFVPFSTEMGYVTRGIDPYSREVRSTMDAFKSRLPGLSETLHARRDLWGEPIPNLESVGTNFASTLYFNRLRNDPATVALQQIGDGWSPAMPDRKIRNVQLTDQEYDDFSRIAGRLTKIEINKLVQSPQWATFPIHIKRDLIKRSFEANREAAANQVMRMYKHIPIDAYNQTVQKKLKD